MIRSALALLVAVTLAAPAFAGDKPDKKGGKKGQGQGPDWDTLIKKLDKDGDGQISKDELAAAKAEHEKKAAEEPKGDEGKKPEGGAPGKKGKHPGVGNGPLAKHFDEIDTNKDGKISKDEFKAFADAMKEKAKDKKGEKGEKPKPAEPKKEEPAPPKVEEPPPVK